MSLAPAINHALANDLLNRVESLMIQAEERSKPLELDPYREQLFELFVVADAAGFTADDADPDLSADGLCRAISERWGLADATRESFAAGAKLPPRELSRMRTLWSLMRMWMEWNYAWKRWAEFHAAEVESIE